MGSFSCSSLSDDELSSFWTSVGLEYSDAGRTALVVNHGFVSVSICEGARINGISVDFFFGISMIGFDEISSSLSSLSSCTCFLLNCLPSFNWSSISSRI